MKREGDEGLWGSQRKSTSRHFRVISGREVLREEKRAEGIIMAVLEFLATFRLSMLLETLWIWELTRSLARSNALGSVEFLNSYLHRVWVWLVILTTSLKISEVRVGSETRTEDCTS